MKMYTPPLYFMLQWKFLQSNLRLIHAENFLKLKSSCSDLLSSPELNTSLFQASSGKKVTDIKKV